jgi:hypothetical protein
MGLPWSTEDDHPKLDYKCPSPRFPMAAVQLANKIP